MIRFSERSNFKYDMMFYTVKITLVYCQPVGLNYNCFCQNHLLSLNIGVLQNKYIKYIN
jgi:hypothetical protein